MVKREMVTRQGYGLGIRGCKRCVTADAGHSLVTLLSLSGSIKDRPVHKTLGKSQTYYPEHILGYGHREGLLLSCRGIQLFPDRIFGGGDSGGLSTILSLELRSGLRVQVWTGTWTL